MRKYRHKVGSLVRVRTGIVKVHEPTMIGDYESHWGSWRQICSPAPNAMGVVIAQESILPITVVLLGGRKWKFHSWDALEVIVE